MSIPADTNPRRTISVAAVTAVAGGVVVLIAILAAVLLLLRDDPPSQPTAEPTSAETRPTDSGAASSATATRTKTETATPTTGPGDVRALQPGLFCRDLDTQGYSYVAAVDYWRMNGQPNQMDADRNGIPCETVYPASDVSAYWDGRSLPELTPAHGLFCRDLLARGLAYPEAVAYWFLEGLPDRMDADLNGIPCETVYPSYAVYEYWYG